MKRFRFKKIDAFTDGKSSGNPAGCVYLDKRGDISDDEMQLIAKELKGFVNEVVYVFPDDGGYFLKYYSSECEVAFCGHGTVAAGYDCIKNGKELSDKDIISIRVGNNHLEIFNKIREDDSIYITAPEPVYYPVIMRSDQVARELNTSQECINKSYDMGLIDAGLKTLIVPIRSLKECLEMEPDQSALKSFCLEHDIDITLVFTKEVSDENNDFRTRVFAPKYGYLEDPATGSGNSAFGCYLLNRKLWNTGSLTIEQNSSYDSPNIVKLRLMKKGDKMFVAFGGKAVVKIEGEYVVTGNS
jgi:PhzF family phenazine biosynthesis protein